MYLLTVHFVKLKSVIFLLCNLEAISSNFIPVKFSGHTVIGNIKSIIGTALATRNSLEEQNKL